MFQPLLAQLQNPNPAQRKQAVAALGAIRHPKARQALRFVYFHDPDQTVRDAALQYLPGIRAKLGLPPANPNAPPPDPRRVIWDCVFCGTRDLTGGDCPNCGAPRPTAADEKAAANSDVSLEALAQTTPSLPVNAGIRRAVQQVPPGAAPQWQQQRAIRRAQRAANNAYALLFLLALFLILIVGLWLARGAVFLRR